MGEGWYSQHVYCAEYQEWQARLSHLIGDERNHKVDDFFVLRDTLLSYTGTDMSPMYFRKGAREGKRYTVDEDFYSYSGGKCHVKMHRKHNDGSHSWKKVSYDDCVFDMLNIFLRARSFDPANWKKGYVVKFPIVDGDGVLLPRLSLRAEKPSRPTMV